MLIGAVTGESLTPPGFGTGVVIMPRCRLWCEGFRSRPGIVRRGWCGGGRGCRSPRSIRRSLSPARLGWSSGAGRAARAGGSSTRLRRRSSTSSRRSPLVSPSIRPSSTSAWLIHRRRHDSLIPRSSAICDRLLPPASEIHGTAPELRRLRCRYPGLLSETILASDQVSGKAGQAPNSYVGASLSELRCLIPVSDSGR